MGGRGNRLKAFRLKTVRLLQLNRSAGGDPWDGETASFLGDAGLFKKAEKFHLPTV
jgi:hypothetical protein